MTRKLTLLVFVALTTFFNPAKAQNFNKAKADSLFDAIQANNRAMMSVAVMQNGMSVYSRVTGNSWIGAQNIKANLATKYRMGSVTKMFTAVMIYQLIEEKKLSLDTKLSDYYPHIPNADKITIAQMLNHSSGIHSFTADADYTSWLSKAQTPAQLIARMTGKSEFEPGSKHEYSNSNFVLLGYIVEKLDKRSYAESLKSRIVNKLKLKDTYYGGKISAEANEAYSYKWENNSWQPETETDMSIPGGAGALVSTPRDLTVFIDGLFNGKLLKMASLEQMRTIKDGFGMNLFQFKFADHTAYGHTGGIDGFRSQAAYFPQDGIAVAYATNGANINLNEVLIGLLSIVYNKPYQIPNFRQVVIKAEDLDKYLGNYSSNELPLKIAITKNGGTLMAQATGQSAFSLEPSATDEFKFAQAGIVLVFEPSSGKMTLKQGGRTFAYQRDK